MRAKTSFSSNREWTSYYRSIWRGTPSNLENKWTSPIQDKRKELNLIDKTTEETTIKRSATYRKRLQEFEKLPASIKEINGFDNLAAENPRILAKILLNHIHSKLMESDIRTAKSDSEKAMANARQQTYSKRLENGSLDAVAINFIIKEVKDYYAEKEKAFSSQLLLKRQVKKKYIKKFIQYVKAMGKPIAPPIENSKRKGLSNRYKNNKRDYLSILGELEGILHISTVVNPVFSVKNQVDLKNYKTNINIEIKEFNKIVNVIIEMQEDEYVDGHSKEIFAFLQSYNRKDLDSRIREEKGKFNNDTSLADKKKEDTIKELKKWSANFISTNSPTKLKTNHLFDRNRHWIGNLLQNY